MDFHHVRCLDSAGLLREGEKWHCSQFIRTEGGVGRWEETTSFHLINSDKTTDLLASAIFTGSEMSAEWDKLLFTNLSTNA